MCTQRDERLSFRKALVEEMFAVGFNPTNLNISAPPDALDRRLNDQASPADLADMPITLEPSFMSIGHLPSAELSPALSRDASRPRHSSHPARAQCWCFLWGVIGY